MSFRFEALNVWPLALEYVDACFILTDRFPQRVQYSIGEQLRRAAVSITANIAEGSGKSTRPSERNFYDIARGSVAETIGVLALAVRRQLISDDHYSRMYHRANLLSSMLLGLIQANTISEQQEVYETASHSLDPILASSPHPFVAPELSDPEDWQTLATRRVFGNRWLGVEIDDVRLPDGRGYEYTRLVPPAPGVAVLGFDAAGRVLLEREYRHGVGAVIWQLPGGLADEDEALQAAGLRELREETGYAPAVVREETVRYLGCVWDNPAFGPAVSHIFTAQGLEPVADQRTDEAEDVTLHWVEPAWLYEAVRQGKIQDRVVLAALAYAILQGVMSNE